VADPRPLDCVIAGGGPAGMVAGLLLARAGVAVTVLEKHADFLRDFRGDTVHASTLALLDDLSLGDAFRRLPHFDEDHLALELDDGPGTLADFRHLPGAYQHISFVPQWDLLDLLAREAARWPWFTLRRRVEAVDLLRDGDRVTGVVARGPDGDEQLRARLTVVADGRGSVLRDKAALPLRTFGATIDVAWFYLPLGDGDRQHFTARFTRGAVAVLVRRETHWQCGFLTAKGRAADLLADGAEPLRTRLAWLVPWLADRVAALTPDDISILDVRIDRLRRWWRPGLIAIGDAAHAMSPVGGVGINLAVQDAVALANEVAVPLRDGRDVDHLLSRVQRRRMPATVTTQLMQRFVHARVLAPAMAVPDAGSTGPVPLPLRAARRFPPLSRGAGRLVGIGLRPERVRAPAVPRP
jgi:2-polyprenyl-6-methoxyphenol hydroxylase-like FAD-dependent oxidoreductase